MDTCGIAIYPTRICCARGEQVSTFEVGADRLEERLLFICQTTASATRTLTYPAASTPDQIKALQKYLADIGHGNVATMPEPLAIAHKLDADLGPDRDRVSAICVVESDTVDVTIVGRKAILGQPLRARADRSLSDLIAVCATHAGIAPTALSTIVLTGSSTARIDPTDLATRLGVPLVEFENPAGFGALAAAACARPSTQKWKSLTLFGLASGAAIVAVAAATTGLFMFTNPSTDGSVDLDAAVLSSQPLTGSSKFSTSPPSPPLPSSTLLADPLSPAPAESAPQALLQTESVQWSPQPELNLTPIPSGPVAPQGLSSPSSVPQTVAPQSTPSQEPPAATKPSEDANTESEAPKAEHPWSNGVGPWLFPWIQ